MFWHLIYEISPEPLVQSANMIRVATMSEAICSFESSVMDSYQQSLMTKSCLRSAIFVTQLYTFLYTGKR